MHHSEYSNNAGVTTIFLVSENSTFCMLFVVTMMVDNSTATFPKEKLQLQSSIYRTGSTSLVFGRLISKALFWSPTVSIYEKADFRQSNKKGWQYPITSCSDDHTFKRLWPWWPIYRWIYLFTLSFTPIFWKLGSSQHLLSAAKQKCI